jgi:hypothetical protein
MKTCRNVQAALKPLKCSSCYKTARMCSRLALQVEPCLNFHTIEHCLKELAEGVFLVFFFF